MFDLKIIHSVLEELQEQKGISKVEFLDAISESLASAYKKQYGERGQIVRAKFNDESGDVDFFRIKEVVSADQILSEEDVEAMDKETYLKAKDDGKTKFIEERHIMVDDAKLIKANANIGDEIVFDLEKKTDFGRVAAMAAKQTIRQKIREAERGYIQKEFGDKEGTIISGSVLRSEGGVVYVDLGKAEGVLPYNEQIKSERYKTGDRIRAYLVKSGEGYRGAVELLLSRTHPEFLKKLFEVEVPEMSEGLVEIKRVVREPGARSKIAVVSNDEDLDPVGTFVGQSGSRVSTVSSELSGERIDIIEWSEDIREFVEAALSPAEITDIEIEEDGEMKKARVYVLGDQFSLAIGKGGQNSRLAAKLTNHKIDIVQVDAEGNIIENEKRGVKKDEGKKEVETKDKLGEEIKVEEGLKDDGGKEEEKSTGNEDEGDAEESVEITEDGIEDAQEGSKEEKTEGLEDEKKD